MSTLEELREGLYARTCIREAQGNPASFEKNRAQLAALDALIAERDAYKARAEKAGVERDGWKNQADHLADRLSLVGKERDELRKALEDATVIMRGPCSGSEYMVIPKGYVLVEMEASVFAALHGTTKQEPMPRAAVAEADKGGAS